MPRSTRSTRVSQVSSAMRFTRSGAVALVGAIALVTPAAAFAGAGDESVSSESTAAERSAAAFGLQSAPKAPPGKAPKGPNPYLAFLPDPSKADYAGWDRLLAKKAEARQDMRTTGKSDMKAQSRQRPILVDEDEPPGVEGGNDRIATAQSVEGFGTGRWDTQRARILGQLSGQDIGVSDIAPNTEDDGSIPLARDTGITATGEAVATTGTVGDGPYGSEGTGTGDFDTYALEGKAGGEIVVEVNAVDGLDPIALLWDAEGNMVASNDDGGGGLNSLLSFPVPEDGTYYAMVTGYLALPGDPFDSASGSGAASEGAYEVTVAQRQTDVDYYAVHLRPGDVVSASVEGNADFGTLYGPDGTKVHGSAQDASSLYPPESPLPGGGNAVTEHVASVEGDHYLAISDGDGRYDVTVEVYRPTAESDRRTQTLFLDFDGERVNTAIFGGPGVRELSPFRAWLGRWGLTRADEEAVARGIIRSVRESVKRDLREQGLAGRIRVRIKNSYDHRDPFGDPNVSRVIVGGSIDESGIPTIGIAQYIDPGNFGHEDSALVLLDVLSGPASDVASINAYLTDDSDRIAFISQAVGNVVAHEAGHFFGSYHTDQYNDVANLMDAGGNFPIMFGVGPDGVGGTSDDPDIDFGADTFNPAEGFTGTEDTLSRTSFGLGRPHPRHRH